MFIAQFKSLGNSLPRSSALASAFIPFSSHAMRSFSTQLSKSATSTMASATIAKQDKILLQGMIFHGRHGVYEPEKQLGQKFIIDAELVTDLHAAGSTDDLALTVDYSKVYSDIRQIVENERCNLLEAVATRIATRVLQQHASLDQVLIRVKKPHVAVPGVVDFLGVEIRRSRQDIASTSPL